MSAHIKECAYREVSCKYCSKTLPYSQLPVSEIDTPCSHEHETDLLTPLPLQSHYEKDCQDYPQPCQQCGKAVSRRKLQQHLQDECDMVKCSVCKSLVSKYDVLLYISTAVCCTVAYMYLI